MDCRLGCFDFDVLHWFRAREFSGVGEGPAHLWDSGEWRVRTSRRFTRQSGAARVADSFRQLCQRKFSRGPAVDVQNGCSALKEGGEVSVREASNPGNRNLIFRRPRRARSAVLESGRMVEPATTMVDSEILETHRLTESDGTESIASSGFWSCKMVEFATKRSTPPWSHPSMLWRVSPPRQRVFRLDLATASPSLAPKFHEKDTLRE